MATKERTIVLLSGFFLLWLGLMIAPAVVAADELQQVEHPTIDYLFTATGLADDYRDVYLEPVSVWYPSGDRDGPASADELRRRATAHFDDALSANGFQRVADPRDNSLIVRIQYIDLTAATASTETLEWARQFRFRVEPGCITIVAEMRDAATDRVIMRIADIHEQNDLGDSLSDQTDLALRQWSEVIASSATGAPEAIQLASRN